MASLGVVSLIHGEARDEALRLFRWFDAEYPTSAPRQFALPHITFLDGDCPDPVALGEAIAAVCSSLPPFDIEIDGFGAFETPRVVYLRVLPMVGLVATHRAVYGAVAPLCRHIAREYGPDMGIPHVTLALKHLEHTEPAVALDRLGDRHPHYRMTVRSIWLAQLDEATNRVHTVREWRLAGKAT